MKHRAFSAVAIVVLGCCITSAGDLESARSTVSKWIATQDLIFREKKEWQEGRELLVSRVEALEKEVAAATARLADSESVLTELRKQKSDTANTERRLVAGSDRLAEAVTLLENDVRRLQKTLPLAIQEKVAPLFRRIPDDPATTRISASERFQNVVGILNEIHKANGEISLVTEIRALSDGKPSEVKTVYVGLGQAYFLSARGEAGTGYPTADGWQWTAANELAPRVAEVIEILENKGKPKFVPLPVTVQ
jgi:hypothetical protein